MPLHPLGVAPIVVVLGEVVATPSHLVLNVSTLRNSPAILLFSLGNKKKLQGARFRHLGGVVHHLDPLLGGHKVPDDAHGALFQWRIKPASFFSGLVCFIFF